MHDNLILIGVLRDGPAAPTRRPRVRAAVEPLKVGVDWSAAHGAWESLRIGTFSRIDGSAVASSSAGLEFRPHEGGVVKEIEFRFVEREEVLCRAPLVCAPVGGGKATAEWLELWLLGSACEGGAESA